MSIMGSVDERHYNEFEACVALVTEPQGHIVVAPAPFSRYNSLV